MKNNILSEITIECPSCGQGLKVGRESMACGRCNSNYPINNDIVEIAEPFKREHGLCPSTRAVGLGESSIIRLIRKINNRISLAAQRERFYESVYKKYISKITVERMLDAGCGGGREILATWGKRIIGLDLDAASLMNASRIYSLCVCASILKIPFAENYFDVVNCADVSGHFLQPDKEVLWRELFRIIRKGGYLISLVELDSNCPSWRMAKEKPELFKKYFVDEFGHIGLEKHAEVLARANNIGFELVYENHVAGIPIVGDYVAWFDNEYKLYHRNLKRLMPLARFLNSRLPLKLFTDCFLGIYSHAVPSRYNPDQSICGMYLFRKA